MGSLFLLISFGCYLFCFGQTLFALRAGHFHAGRIQVAAMAMGAAFQFWWLWLRGQEIQGCPITTLREVLIFLGGAIALLYLLIGTAYRISLLGAFTAPLLLLLQIAALLLPAGALAQRSVPNPWIEAHAALSLLAYAAFGLACVAGLMFLLQEKQLKSRRPSSIFHHLPPISVLSLVVLRLVWAGFLLLSLGFAAGWISRLPIAGSKGWFSLLIWLLYALFLSGSRLGLLGAHRKALLAAGIFLLVLVLLPVIQHLSLSPLH